METAWIEVFILTLAECVAPAGKTVCQEQQFELHFQNRGDCEYALQQFIAMKDELDYVIVNRAKSRCSPSAIEAETFSDLEAIEAAKKDSAGWRTPDAVAARRSVVNSSHSDRLSALQSCEESSGVAPCTIGDIIVEEAGGDDIEVWRRGD